MALCEETGRIEMVIEIRQIVLNLAERMDRIESGLRGPEPRARGFAVSVSPDTSVLRLLVRREGPARLVFEASSDALGLHNRDLGSLSLEGDPKAQAQDELGRSVDGLSDLAVTGERGQESARHQLADMAVALFRKLPRDVRQLLLSQAGRIETLQILSDEPYIPWELMKLQDDDGKEGLFLCEAFRVTRWLRDFPQTVSTLPLRSIALVLTTDSNLPSSRAEKEDLATLAGADRLTEIEPSLLGVKQALLNGNHDGWHFTGHGSARAQDPNRMAIHLQGSDFLTPENLVTAKANLSRLRPLVFLNGCDTGRGGFSLTGLGGWAQQSLEAGAGAFLGTLWPVRDRKARAFASAFYRVFLGGAPIADAVRQARLHVREQFPGDPAWLAYTVYAFPGAVCASTPHVMVRQVPQPALLKLPELEWKSESSSPGQLLQAEYGVVPFHGREKEGDDLYAWCVERQPVHVRLYTGPGGMGKTRLAIEIAQRLRREGWLAGFLEQESQELWQEISRPGGKVLAIVDYAETRRHLLLPLLRGLADFRGPGRVRLILLARAALDWWEQLKREDKQVGALLSGPATTRHSLPPLALRLQDRIESHHLAGRSFAERLGKPSPAKISEGLEAEFFDRVLFLHMAAYVQLQGKKQARSEDDILDEMLRHEGRYWKKRAMDDKKLAESLVPGIRRAMAAITLGGGVHGETEAVEILRRLHAFQGHTGDVLLEVAHLLHECYPGNNRWIEPILPDLLGEHLIQREMERGGDELLDLVLGPSAADGGAFDDPRS